MKLYILAFWTVVLSTSTFGKIHHICNQASGNNTGIDWDNAYTSFTAAGLHSSKGTAGRGDTFFVAGTDIAYPSLTLSNAPLNGQSIVIQKATDAIHGTQAGWKPAFGGKPAIFRASLRIESNDWVFDGKTGGGPLSWNSGYGFKIFDSACAEMTKLIRMKNSPSGITIRHVDCVFEGAAGGTSSRDLDAVYAYGGSSRVTISYCAFRYAGRDHVFLSNADGLTVEYCYHLSNRMCTSQHAQSWEDQGSNNVTIRNNLFRGCRGTGIIVVLSRGGTKSSNAWKIYGNIFLNDAQGYTTDGVVAVINNEGASNWNIHNNSFVDMNKSGMTGLAFSQSAQTSSGIEIYNNLWYNCGKVVYSGGARIAGADYSYFVNSIHSPEPNEQVGTTNPYVSMPDQVYNLKEPTKPGKVLAAEYAVDMHGNHRDHSAGSWDRGAIEYNEKTAITISIAKPDRPFMMMIHNSPRYRDQALVDFLGRARQPFLKCGSGLYLRKESTPVPVFHTGHLR